MWKTLLFGVVLSGAGIFGGPPSFAAPVPQAGGVDGPDPFGSLHVSLLRAADNAVAEARNNPVEQRLVSAGLQREAKLATSLDSRFVDGDPFRLPGEERLSLSVSRVNALRPFLAPILREEGVPEELIGVVVVESGGQLNALSPKGARGLWQIMPATAERYGLRVKWGADQRLDPLLATRAAARYLRDLHHEFGNWQLALAAYNSGERIVERAIARAERPDFALLTARRLIPEETRKYVPAVLGAGRLLGVSKETNGAALEAPATTLRVFARAGIVDEGDSAERSYAAGSGRR